MREKIENESKRLEMPLVGPDDPIYNEPVTVLFISKHKRPDSGVLAQREVRRNNRNLKKPRSTIEVT